MIVVCEGCQRRFQLDDARIPEKGARVRCKHCHHRFRVSPPGDTSTEARSPSASVSPVPEGEGSRSARGDDTLFGPGGGGAPIDGDRTLFGSAVDEGTEDPAPGALQVSGEARGGVATQDLHFVTEPPASGVGDARPGADDGGPAGRGTAAAAGSSDGDEEAGDEDWEFVDPGLSFDAELQPEAPAEPAPESPAADEVADPEDSLEAMQIDPGGSHPGAQAAVADETPSMRAVGPGAGHDGATFDLVEGTDPGEPLRLAGADEPAPEADHAAPEAALDDEASGSGNGAAAFDFPDEAGEDLFDAELHELPTDPDPPDEATETPRAALGDCSAAAEPGVAEIGSPADGDRLAQDDEARDDGVDELPVDPVAGEPTVSEAPRPPDPDWPTVPADLAERPAPVRAARGPVWLEHASWVLSVALLLAVAQGTVRIRPTDEPAAAGRVEVAGLTAENVRGRFVESARSGMLYVVSGELRNRSTAPQRARALRVVVLDEHGLAFDDGAAPVGPALPVSAVRETRIGALHAQQRRLSQSVADRSLAPGEGRGFQAIFGPLPAGAVRFRLEAAPSRPERRLRPGGEPEAG